MMTIDATIRESVFILLRYNIRNGDIFPFQFCMHLHDICIRDGNILHSLRMLTVWYDVYIRSDFSYLRFDSVFLRDLIYHGSSLLCLMDISRHLIHFSIHEDFVVTLWTENFEMNSSYWDAFYTDILWFDRGSTLLTLKVHHHSLDDAPKDKVIHTKNYNFSTRIIYKNRENQRNFSEKIIAEFLTFCNDSNRKCAFSIDSSLFWMQNIYPSIFASAPRTRWRVSVFPRI